MLHNSKIPFRNPLHPETTRYDDSIMRFSTPRRRDFDLRYTVWFLQIHTYVSVSDSWWWFGPHPMPNARKLFKRGGVSYANQLSMPIQCCKACIARLTGWHERWGFHCHRMDLRNHTGLTSRHLCFPVVPNTDCWCWTACCFCEVAYFMQVTCVLRCRHT